MDVAYRELYEDASLSLIKTYNIFLYKLHTNINAAKLYINNSEAKIVPSDMLRCESYQNNQVFPTINFISIPNGLFVLTDQDGAIVKEAYKDPPYLIQCTYPNTINLSAPYITKTSQVEYGNAQMLGYYILTQYPTDVKTRWLCVDNLTLTKIGKLSIYTTDNTNVNHNLNIQYPKHQIQSYFGYILYGYDQVRAYELDYRLWKKYFCVKKPKSKLKFTPILPQQPRPLNNNTTENSGYTYTNVVEYNTPATTSAPPESVFQYEPDAINPCD